MDSRVTIDDDLLIVARKLAEQQGQPLDTFISNLLRAALQGARIAGTKNGLPIFGVPAGADPITPDDVRRAQDEP